MIRRHAEINNSCSTYIFCGFIPLCKFPYINCVHSITLIPFEIIFEKTLLPREGNKVTKVASLSQSGTKAECTHSIAQQILFLSFFFQIYHIFTYYTVKSYQNKTSKQEYTLQLNIKQMIHVTGIFGHTTKASDERVYLVINMDDVCHEKYGMILLLNIIHFLREIRTGPSCSKHR